MNTHLLEGPPAITLSAVSHMPKPASKSAKPAKTAAPSKVQYTIDELASATRVPSRTIRFYQSKGALQKPEIVGRVAYYNDKHVERLELIAQLQDRGLSIKAIRDLTRDLDAGKLDLNEWLGLETTLKAPWSTDDPLLLKETELQKRFGDLRPGVIGELIGQRLIEKKGDAFFIPSPRLLGIALALEKAGIDLHMAAGGADIIRKHIQKAAAELADYYLKHAGRGFGRQATAKDLSTAFEAIRPTGLDAVQLIFGREMERVLRKLVESGRTASLPDLGKR